VLLQPGWTAAWAEAREGSNAQAKRTPVAIAPADANWTRFLRETRISIASPQETQAKTQSLGFLLLGEEGSGSDSL
jgi:hypothetical protein